MWVPKSVYESAPRYWILIGILLLVVGIYIGREVHPVYFMVGGGTGLCSVFWGIRVYDKRQPDRLFETRSFDASTIHRD